MAEKCRGYAGKIKNRSTQNIKAPYGGATVKPSYIAVGPADMHGMTPVIAVQAYMVFETTLSAAAGEGGLRAGSKVTLSADGLQVTATTASGVAEIVSIDGGAVGDTVLVKF